jgi:hypothetical protein
LLQWLFKPIFAANNYLMKLTTRLLLFTALLIAVNVIIKILFAPMLTMSGFSPLIGIALFSGMMVSNRNASFLMPLVALFVSDVIIELLYRANLFAFAGFYKYQFINYTLILLTTLLGWAFKARNITNVLVGAVAGPTFFFILSNFCVWFFGNHTTYSNDMNGLVQCYTAGLPFYGRALWATIIFLPLIIVSYNYIVRSKPKLTLA